MRHSGCLFQWSASARRLCGLATCAGAALAMAEQAIAEAWLQAAEVGLFVRAEDNVRLNQSGDDDVVTQLRGALGAGYRTERSSAFAELSADANRYAELDTLNHENIGVDADLSHQWERSSVNLGLGYSRESTLRSELETTGLVQEDIRRVQYYAQPSWSHQLGVKSSVSVQYYLADVDYAASGSGLTDYEYQTVQVTYQYTEDETRSWWTSGSALQYEPKDIPLESSEVGIQAGVQQQFSPQFSASVSVGIRDEESTRTFLAGTPFAYEVTEEDTGLSFDLGAVRQLPLGQLEAELRRRVDPGSTGELLQRDQFLLRGLHPLSERLSFRWQFSYYSNEEVSGLSGSATEEYNFLRVEPRLSWRASPEWVFDVAYRYRRRDRDGAGDADSNTVLLSVRYQAPTQIRP